METPRVDTWLVRFLYNKKRRVAEHNPFGPFSDSKAPNKDTLRSQRKLQQNLRFVRFEDGHSWPVLDEWVSGAHYLKNVGYRATGFKRGEQNRVVAYYYDKAQQTRIDRMAPRTGKQAGLGPFMDDPAHVWNRVGVLPGEYVLKDSDPALAFALHTYRGMHFSLSAVGGHQAHVFDARGPGGLYKLAALANQASYVTPSKKPVRFRPLDESGTVDSESGFAGFYKLFEVFEYKETVHSPRDDEDDEGDDEDDEEDDEGDDEGDEGGAAADAGLDPDPDGLLLVLIRDHFNIGVVLLTDELCIITKPAEDLELETIQDPLQRSAGALNNDDGGSPPGVFPVINAEKSFADLTDYGYAVLRSVPKLGMTALRVSKPHEYMTLHLKKHNSAGAQVPPLYMHHYFKTTPQQLYDILVSEFKGGPPAPAGGGGGADAENSFARFYRTPENREKALSRVVDATHGVTQMDSPTYYTLVTKKRGGGRPDTKPSSPRTDWFGYHSGRERFPVLPSPSEVAMAQATSLSGNAPPSPWQSVPHAAFLTRALGQWPDTKSTIQNVRLPKTIDNDAYHVATMQLWLHCVRIWSERKHAVNAGLLALCQPNPKRFPEPTERFRLKATLAMLVPALSPFDPATIERVTRSGGARRQRAPTFYARVEREQRATPEFVASLEQWFSTVLFKGGNAPQLTTRWERLLHTRKMLESHYLYNVFQPQQQDVGTRKDIEQWMNRRVQDNEQVRVSSDFHLKPERYEYFGVNHLFFVFFFTFYWYLRGRREADETTLHEILEDDRAARSLQTLLASVFHVAYVMRNTPMFVPSSMGKSVLSVLKDTLDGIPLMEQFTDKHPTDITKAYKDWADKHNDSAQGPVSIQKAMSYDDAKAGTTEVTGFSMWYRVFVGGFANYQVVTHLTWMQDSAPREASLLLTSKQTAQKNPLSKVLSVYYRQEQVRLLSSDKKGTDAADHRFSLHRKVDRLAFIGAAQVHVQNAELEVSSKSLAGLKSILTFTLYGGGDASGGGLPY